MQSSLVKEIDKYEVNVTSSSDSGAQEALVAAARRRDEQAFETLVKRNQAKIFSLALRYTRVPEDAEDVVQQTFQKAFVYLHKFEGKSSLSTWLTRIAINEALMLLRRGGARREVSLDDSGSDQGTTSTREILDASPDPEAAYLRQEGARILSAAIKHLTPGLRTAIELKELGELTAGETALRMGLSVSAAKARVFHGKRKLRERLGRYMGSGWRVEHLHFSDC